MAVARHVRLGLWDLRDGLVLAPAGQRAAARRDHHANYNHGVLLAVLHRREDARTYLSRACEARIRDACSMLTALGRAR